VITAFDDFFQDPDGIRAHALATPFVDWDGFGETYKRVALVEVPGLHEGLERRLGRRISMLGMGYRLNFNDELPNAAIHSDMGWGTHAAVVYLAHPPEGHEGGTAFWRHQGTLASRIDPGDVELFEAVRHDWNTLAQWEMQHLIPWKFNRAAIYASALFHSRWPMEAFGTGPDDGRLIAVAFFNLEG